MKHPFRAIVVAVVILTVGPSLALADAQGLLVTALLFFLAPIGATIFGLFFFLALSQSPAKGIIAFGAFTAMMLTSVLTLELADWDNYRWFVLIQFVAPLLVGIVCWLWKGDKAGTSPDV